MNVLNLWQIILGNIPKKTSEIHFGQSEIYFGRTRFLFFSLLPLLSFLTENQPGFLSNSSSQRSIESRLNKILLEIRTWGTSFFETME